MEKMPVLNSIAHTLLLMLITLMLTDVQPVVSSVVTINNNGYRGIIVAIHENVTEDVKIIENIKAMLTKASSHLHHVTRRRAFLEEVTIVVPSSWSAKPEYQTILGGGGDYFRKADVRVDAPNPSYGNEPYTLQPGQCGEPGQYIHLTPDFLLGNDGTTLTPQGSSNSNSGQSGAANPNVKERSPAFGPYGDLSPVFVHEFAHLRYGVFDEHGVKGDAKSPFFFKDNLGKIRSTGCPSGLRGMVADSSGGPCRRGPNGLPDDRCTFYPDLNPKLPMRLSIMYMPGVDLADGFCDDDSPNRRHNPIAPNKHNLMCQGRSTWDVVSSHADFRGNKNPPRDVADKTPKFRLIHLSDYRHQTVLLVLDLSGSMKGHRMNLLHSAVTRFIQYELVAGLSTLGIVGFDETAKVLAQMTDVLDTNRAGLIASVPKKEFGGYTSIGSGLREGLNVLRRGGRANATEGARIVLVSDGEENKSPTVDDVMAEVVASGVVVTTIALGKKASDKLEELVRATGGNSYFYDDNNSKELTGLDASFTAALTLNAPVELQAVMIGNRNATLAPKETLESYFNVDKEIGKGTSFRVTYGAGGANILNLVIVSPSRKVFDSKSPEFRSDVATHTVGFQIPQAESGKWTYKIENSGAVATKVTLVVSSEANDQKDQPIRIRSWVSDIEFTHPARVKVYAEVKKGYAAVFEASVTAKVYRPDGTSHPLPLFDDGVGADTTANDGIYSAYFAKFQGQGRYSVEADVVNDGRAKLIVGRGGKSSSAPPVPVLPKGVIMDDSQEDFSLEQLLKPSRVDETADKNLILQDLDDFERSTQSGSFRLNNWVDNVHDLIPPGDVTDLKVIETNLQNRTVHLMWTAVGDDLDDGIAHRTEIRFHHEPLYLLHSFNTSNLIEEAMLQNGTTLSPPEPKTYHHVIINLPSLEEEAGFIFLNESNNMVFFRMRTRDEAGNVADISNMATAEFKFPSLSVNSPQMDANFIGFNGLIVVLVIAGCVLLIVAITVAIVLKRRSSGRTSIGSSNACITNEEL